MNGWLSSFNRKKHQRYMNKYVRAINKNIYNDDLWRGRFVVRQVDSPYFYTYEDGSGASLERVHLVITDRLNGRTIDGWDSVNGWCHWNGSKLWQWVNDAIVEGFDVWHEHPNPYDTRGMSLYDFREKNNGRK